MAERSKAPDSRETFSVIERVFLSSYEGVGSNPTSDKIISFFYSLLAHFIIISASNHFLLQCLSKKFSLNPNFGIITELFYKENKEKQTRFGGLTKE